MRMPVGTAFEAASTRGVAPKSRTNLYCSEMRDMKQASLPVHDGSCMGTGVMPIWGQSPPRVKQVDAGPEVAISWVCCHDSKLLPEDVCYGHVCTYANATVRRGAQTALLAVQHAVLNMHAGQCRVGFMFGYSLHSSVLPCKWDMTRLAWYHGRSTFRCCLPASRNTYHPYHAWQGNSLLCCS